MFPPIDRRLLRRAGCKVRNSGAPMIRTFALVGRANGIDIASAAIPISLESFGLITTQPHPPPRPARCPLKQDQFPADFLPAKSTRRGDWPVSIELAPLDGIRLGAIRSSPSGSSLGLVELVAPTVEEWVVADQKRARVLLDEGGEGGVDLAFCSGLQDKELHPLCPRRFLHVSHRPVRHSDCSGSQAG
jgi:hypothetical protein